MSEDQELNQAPAKQEELYADPAFKEMVDAGLFYGRKKSRTNPRMKPYILTNRNEIEIINLAKTEEGVEKAVAFLTGKTKSGGMVLFVATQPPAEEVKKFAEDLGFPYVVTRWLGGALTNFRIIGSRIDHYKKLKADWAKNAFDKYTKKEKLEIEREIIRLTETLGGLEVMTRLPDVMVVLDSNLHATAVREARRMKIPVVGFVNTDSDPDVIDYVIAGNTKARLSINWLLDKFREPLNAARNEAKAKVMQPGEVKKNDNPGAESAKEVSSQKE
jgi:small subunit ribosomal protein S2